MAAKISNLSELYPNLKNDEKISDGVLGLIGRFNLKRLLKPLSEFKKRGIGLTTLLSTLILCRFRGLSIYSMYKSGQMQIDENSIYRIMNHSAMNWRLLLLGTAMQFLKITRQSGGENKGIRCFVIDDTVVSKTGKTIEGISKIFDHVSGTFVLGFKMLTLALWDGKSLLPLDFSLHRESQKKNWGLNVKELKRLFKKERDKDTPSIERLEELDIEKPTSALQMLQRASKHNILAAYVLMDSWFTNDTVIKGIRKIRKGIMHVVGACKMDKRNFEVDGRSLNSDAIIKLKGLRKGGTHYSRKYKSEYIVVDATYKGTAVKLFYIKYKRSKDWRLLLTTDLSLSFVRVMELYQIRWSIEVLFKECKQYLRLGQAQNTDLDGQIADMTITLITHLILSLQLRFQAYETMGGLFREIQDQMIQDTLHQRIMNAILEIIDRLLEILSIDVEETIELMIASNEKAEEVIKLLRAVNVMHNDTTKIKQVA